MKNRQNDQFDFKAIINRQYNLVFMEKDIGNKEVS